MHIQNKTKVCRIALYLFGLLVLALGITLNTKVSLGVSPIISVSYSISSIWNLNFGNTTLGLYILFIVVEMGLHVLWSRQQDPKRRRMLLLLDILQLPLSLIFTRFLNLFGTQIPNFAEQANTFVGSLTGRILLLLLAIVLTGIGAALSLNMRIVPNPGDGIVQAIADCLGWRVGFTKNCFDVCNITVTIMVSLLCTGQLIGVGVGTVLAVIGVGRVIALINHFGRVRMLQLAGIEESM